VTDEIAGQPIHILGVMYSTLLYGEPGAMDRSVSDFLMLVAIVIILRRERSEDIY
jgi:hypothetical protein